MIERGSLIAAYGAHRDAAYRVAYGILGEGPAAEDAVQDAFIKLLVGESSFDASRGSMHGLLMTIARHTSIDVKRRQANRQRNERAYCADVTWTSEGPEQTTERFQDAQQVRSALQTIPAKQQRVIELAYFSGLTCSEIAAAIEVPIGTVKSRLRLGLRRLDVALKCGIAEAGRLQAPHPTDSMTHASSDAQE